MSNPKNVFRYSSAVTAGYGVTLPIAAWVGRRIAGLATVTEYGILFAALCFGAWCYNGDPGALTACYWSLAIAAIAGVLLLGAYCVAKRLFKP